jgi:hypothetical protein
MRQRRGAAEEDVGVVGVHPEAVGRGLDAVAHEQLAEVLGDVPDALGRGAEGQAVVAEGHLRVDGGERVHLHVQRLAGAVLVRVAPREVEAADARRGGEERRRAPRRAMGAVGSGSGGEGRGGGSSFAVDLGGGGPLSGEVLAGRRGRGGAGRGGADLVAGGAK